MWLTPFERFRRAVLSAAAMGIEGKLQREGEVIHVIATRVVDLSKALSQVGEREGFSPPHGPGDEARRGGGPDRRDLNAAFGLRTKEVFNPDLRVVARASLRVKPRDFR